MSGSAASPPVRDLDWIKQALQTAIELECSTLPIYLSAMLSLKVQNNIVYTQLRWTAMDEMAHMATAANILACLGGTPRIKGIAVKFPAQGLPGGVEPDLLVGLAKLSEPQLLNFMRIETPDFLLRKLNRGTAYPTIADFYREIRRALVDNADAVRAAVKAGGASNQVYDDIGIAPIIYTEGVDPLDSILSGIKRILEQGEGASTGSLVTTSEFERETSHYARFAELFYGASYNKPDQHTELTPDTEPMFFAGLAIGRPIVINTLAVPSDGYAKILALDPNAAAVTKDLGAFDAAYAQTLAALDLAWNGPQAASWKTVGLSVRGVGGNPPGMIDMRVLGRENITRHLIPPDIVARLAELYPGEYAFLAKYTDLAQPVFYGPRFLNVPAQSPPAGS